MLTVSLIQREIRNPYPIQVNNSIVCICCLNSRKRKRRVFCGVIKTDETVSVRGDRSFIVSVKKGIGKKQRIYAITDDQVKNASLVELTVSRSTTESVFANAFYGFDCMVFCCDSPMDFANICIRYLQCV